MIKIGWFMIGFSACSFVGCSTIDANSAKALGATGHTAAQTLADQTDAGRKVVDSLPEWWGVRNALTCSVVTASDPRTACIAGARSKVDPELQKAQADLSKVLTRRVVAATALRDAYQSFGNLATYDAGGETEQAITAAFGAIEELSKAAASIAPQGAVLPPITKTFTTAASGLGRFIASKRQEQLMYSAALDLHTATDAMVKALSIERDSKAMKMLLAALQAESDQLYFAFVESGLVAPKDALTPLFLQIAPSGQLIQPPPPTNMDVIKIAAGISIAARSDRQQLAATRSYDAAVSALRSLAAEHVKLEEKEPLNLERVLADVKTMQKLLADLKAKE